MDALRLVIMCKAPVPGRVKTRLMTGFSAEEAARIHCAMATTVIQRARRLFDTVYIAADDIEHGFFQRFGLPLLAQGQGDLGERMSAQMRTAFEEQASAVLFLGTDSPHITDQRLLKAAQSLADTDVILGPVEDGGYDLIGLRGNWPVFDGVIWSSGAVLKQTVANCRMLGLSSKQLATSFDIDTPEDLLRAAESGWKAY